MLAAFLAQIPDTVADSPHAAVWWAWTQQQIALDRRKREAIMEDDEEFLLTLKGS